MESKGWEHGRPPPAKRDCGVFLDLRKGGCRTCHQGFLSYVAPGETSPEECTPCEIDRKDKRIAKLEAALRQIAKDKCEDNPAASCYKGFTASGGWCNSCTAKATLEADDGE
jgi:hypothetical protein